MPSYAFPTLPSGRVPNVLSWGTEANSFEHVSPFTGDDQTIEMPGIKWAGTLGFRDLALRDSGVMCAFLSKLHGQANRFFIPYWPRRRPLGGVSGAPQVNGAGQTGSVLNITGLPASRIVFQEGDMFSVLGRLKMVIGTATSDAGGNAALSFDPPIYVAPPNATLIVWDTPTCLVKLTEDSVRWVARAQQAEMTSFEINWRESLV